MAKKTLFKTPNSGVEMPAVSSSSSKTEELQSFMKKIEVEMLVEKNFKAIGKEMLEKRLENMRDILKETADDEWKFERIEELLNF